MDLSCIDVFWLHQDVLVSQNMFYPLLSFWCMKITAHVTIPTHQFIYVYHDKIRNATFPPRYESNTISCMCKWS